MSVLKCRSQEFVLCCRLPVDERVVLEEKNHAEISRSIESPFLIYPAS